MFQLGGLHPDRSELEEVRGHAPAPMRSKNLQIALNRTTAGVALVSALALCSGAGLLLLPQAAQAAQAKPTAKWKIGDCFFFADRWWCP